MKSRRRKELSKEKIAIERELEVRLERTRALKVQDEELHLLRVKEQKLKNEEQEVKLQMAKVRLAIVEEELKKQV